METSLLDSTTRKQILYDVLDGIPASKNESAAEQLFRKSIEHDDVTLESMANQLGVENALLEFSSSGEI